MVYRDYYQIVNAIECLIIAYRARGETKIVEGLEMALGHVKMYQEYSEEGKIELNARKLFDFL